MATWKKTPFTGIRYREHPTRKHGIQKDKYFSIRYQADGERIEEGLGWLSDGWNAEKAALQLAELKSNHKTGKGHSRLKAKRATKKKIEERRQTKLITVSQFWKDDYVKTLKTRVKASSAIKEIQHFEKRIEPAVGSKPLIQVTPEDIEKIRDNMIPDGFAPRTIQYMVGTFFRIWKHAAKRKRVRAGDNPAMGIAVEQVNNERTRVMTPEEFQAILKTVKALSVEAFNITLFCAYTGSRFSEAANLTWENVDFERKTAFFPETKNRQSREIDLSKPVIEMLKTIPSQETGNHVFVMKTGKRYIEPPAAFRTAVNKLKLNEGHATRDCISFHSLRHTAATLAARRGTNPRDLQDMFGWKVPAMVFRYAKGDRAAQKRAANGLVDALNPKPKKAKVVKLNRKKG